MKKTLLLAMIFAAQLSVTACSGGTGTETAEAAAEIEAGTAALTADSETENPDMSTGAAEPGVQRQEEPVLAEIAPNQQPAVTVSQGSEQTGEASHSSVLVAYFSRAENIGGTPSVDAVSSASINIRDAEVVGNMRAMAEVIQDLTGGDIFSIQTERSYSQNYRESTNEARAELNSDARPALATHVEDMSL